MLWAPCPGLLWSSHSDGTRAVHQSLPLPLLLTFTDRLPDRFGGHKYSLQWWGCFVFELKLFLRWWSTWSGLKPPQWTTWGVAEAYSLLCTEHEAWVPGPSLRVALVVLNCFLCQHLSGSRELSDPTNAELFDFLSRTLTMAPSCWLLLKVTYTT